MVEAIVQQREKARRLGKHWLSLFLKCQPELASHMRSWLHHQRAFARDPQVINDYFQKVFSPFSLYKYTV